MYRFLRGTNLLGGNCLFNKKKRKQTKKQRNYQPRANPGSGSLIGCGIQEFIALPLVARWRIIQYIYMSLRDLSEQRKIFELNCTLTTCIW